MKVFNKKREFLILIMVIFVGYNFVLNFYLKQALNAYNIKINYFFAVSLIPDRITLVNPEYENFKCLFLDIDFYIKNLLQKKFDKCINGISLAGLKYEIEYGKNENKKNENSIPFVLPFFEYINIYSAKIIFSDKKTGKKIMINNINGSSKVNKAKYESDKYVEVNCKGNFNKKNNEFVFLKLIYYPYYKNKFFLNLFGSKLSAIEFNEIFKDSNIKINEGKINFLIQLKGEGKKIFLNNIMQFENLKIVEESWDMKEIFGLSVKQLFDFLKDSKGDFYINFDYSLNTEEFIKILDYYTEKFIESIRNRVILGVVTAPVRQLKDLIWNITGENVIRIFKLFGGE